MAKNRNKTTVRRVKANDTGRTNKKAIEAEEGAAESTVREERGAAVRGADWLLSRLPWFKYRYLDWSHTKRIIVGYLMWLIVLPIIPVILLVLWYAHDPEGFRKSPVTAVLTALLLAWVGGTGWVFNQTPITDGTPMANVKAQAGGEQGVENSDPAAIPSRQSKEKIAKQSSSNATNGRKFENCTAAFEAGVFDIKRNDPSYERRLDRDNDGIACEK